MFLTIFRRFPTISEDFRKFSKCCPKVVRMFPNIFREFPKFSEDFRRLPKKIRRFFDLISIYFGSFSIGTWQTLQADWSKMISHMCGYHFYPHMWDTIFLDLLPLAKALQFISEYILNHRIRCIYSPVLAASRDVFRSIEGQRKHLMDCYEKYLF